MKMPLHPKAIGNTASNKARNEANDDSGYDTGNPENWKIPGNGTGMQKKYRHQNLTNIVGDSSGGAYTDCAEFTCLFQDYHKDCAEHAACNGKSEAHGVAKKNRHQNNTDDIDKHGAV